MKSKIKGLSDEAIKMIFESYTKNESLLQTLNDFSDMRKEKNKPFMTKAALTRLLNKLNRIASTDEIKIEILEKSILNNWQDIWEPKVTFSKPVITKAKRSFIADSQGNTDDLEGILLGKNDLDDF